MSSGWRTTTLGELERESNGVIQTGPFGSQLHASDYSDVGTPVVMPTNIRDLRISTHEIARVSREHVERLSRHKLQPGDIVYSRRGDVEKCALVTEIENGWLCGTGCLLVRVGGPTVDARCLAYALALPATRNWISQHAVGATMPNLNTGVLRAVPVYLPPIAEQRSIAATLGTLDDKIESNRRSVELSLALLDAISFQQSAVQPKVPLASLAQLVKTVAKPATYGDRVVRHYSLPAFDSGARAERVAASSVMSNKVALERPAILVSRLNPRFNRTWWVEPEPEKPAFASPEFAMLQASDRRSLAAVWLAVRDETFREKLIHRAMGTSGSHQRIRPGDMLAIEVPDTRLASGDVLDGALLLLDRIESQRRETEALINVRNALLPELLSDRIRVPIEEAS